MEGYIILIVITIKITITKTIGASPSVFSVFSVVVF